MRSLSLLFLLVLIGTACGPPLPAEIEQATAALPEEIDFNLHVKPILSDRCYACHGPDKEKQKASLRLDEPTGAYAELTESPGRFAIVPGAIEESEMVRRILAVDPEVQMPPPESHLSLSAAEKALLIRWIDEGAEYKPHWSLSAPLKQTPPEIDDDEKVHNPIDRFVQARLEREGFGPAPQAEKEILLRRLTLDLTGLPPTLQELDAFLADQHEDAYEKVVDRLLASPQFGERMAVDWLDLARFADTHGYTVDRYRDMSPWRDWVIKALNANMPYDHFVTWQLAGDLFPQPSKEQMLATGFNRNHPQNMEGGIVPEEFRVAYVVDRTNTLGTAFLGLTVECARCHDHKYDPISQKEYYELYSFFNNVNEAGQISYDNAMAVPTMLLTDEEVDAQVAYLTQQIETAAATPIDTTGLGNWMQNKRRNLKIAPRPIAHFSLERLPVQNQLNPRQKGSLKQQHSPESQPELTDGKKGKGVALNGDAWLDLGEVGVFGRADAFSVGAWFWVPEELSDGVLFHKGEGAAIFNFRGYHVALKDNRLELLMARTTPDNAIIEYAPELPRNQWVHVLMTYDGASSAEGLRLYLNGEEVNTEVEVDHLYKDILFDGRKQQPGLQIGARWRGKGIKGARVDEIKVFAQELTALEVRQLVEPKTVQDWKLESYASLNQPTRQLFQQHFAQRVGPNLAVRKEQLSAFRQQLYQTQDTLAELMVMRERSQPRQAFILNRGQYDDPTEPVFPTTPSSLLPFPASYPTNRLGLARWLFHPEHPLTARVAVNRYWQLLFGTGLVKTSDDFGNQGELPSHPELLDWLAVHFMESAWDVKGLLKLMVMSHTYQQSSVGSAELIAKDVENRWLGRGPASRLTAEMIRDQALAVSGLLVRKIGGPSVKPYQPAGLWRVNGGRYEQDEGEALYRRSLYTFWKRSVPHPTQGTFDAPTRSYCTVKRQKTSTPLQALVLLNDPTFVEAARVLGTKMLKADRESAIRSCFRSLTAREPQEAEVAVLLEIWETEQEQFRLNPTKAEGWLRTGAKEANADFSSEELAAAAVVASTMLNADASVVKR